MRPYKSIVLSVSLSERCVGDEKEGLFIKVLKMNAFRRDASKKHYCCQLTLLPSFWRKKNALPASAFLLLIRN